MTVIAIIMIKYILLSCNVTGRSLYMWQHLQRHEKMKGPASIRLLLNIIDLIFIIWDNKYLGRVSQRVIAILPPRTDD